MPRVIESGSPLAKALRAGEVCLGYFLMLEGAATARAIARVPGLKWILVDGEHGQLSDSELRTAIHAIAPWGVSPMVRTPGPDNHLIKRALDAGAHGIIVPMVPDAETAASIVASCRFPPLGKRGVGSPFCKDAFNYETDNEYLDHANEDVLVACMIETKQGYENHKAIIDTPGVDIIFVGGSDFSLSFGYPLNREAYPPALTEIVMEVQAYARSRGKFCASMARKPEAVKVLAERGVTMISLGVDQWTLQTAIKAEVGNALSLLK